MVKWIGRIIHYSIRFFAIFWVANSLQLIFWYFMSGTMTYTTSKSTFGTTSSSPDLIMPYWLIILSLLIGIALLLWIINEIRLIPIDTQINTIPKKESNKKPKAGIAIKRRDKFELLIFLYLVFSTLSLAWVGLDSVVGQGAEGLLVASAIIGIYALWRFLVLFVQKRYFYCPKCKNKCKWEVTDSRIDDLTTRRKDGQVDRRYSSVTVRYYYFKYYCTDTPKNFLGGLAILIPWEKNPTCGYVFGEWQSTYTYSEKQNYYNN